MSGNDEIFYVYAYLDPRKPGDYKYEEFSFNFEPFYIGKGYVGRQNRMKEHLREAYTNYDIRIGKRNFKCSKIRKIKKETNLKPIIVKVKKNINEKEAFDLEIKLISLIGRFNLGKGPLTNLTNGGEGASGCIWTEERKRKLSKRVSGKLNPMYGKTFTKEHKLKCAHHGENHHMFGKKHSEETLKKMSKSLTGRKLSKETIEKFKNRPKKGKKVIANGIKFEFMQDACEKLGITMDALRYRIRTGKEGYKYEW